VKEDTRQTIMFVGTKYKKQFEEMLKF